MARLKSLMLAGMLAVSASLPLAGAGGAAPAADPQPMQLGVVTHFGQGWPERYWTLLEQTPATLVRDGLAWRLVEPEPGAGYVFDARSTGHVDRICAMGRKAVLTLLPRHPLLDNGETVHSAAALRAFGLYARAVADRYRSCLVALEIDNEINSRKAVTGPAADDVERSHIAIVAAVNGALGTAHKDLAILGGSAHSVATGFLGPMFDKGLMREADALTIHIYRPDPSNLDWEIDLLRQRMAAAGPVKPIWVTEFSHDKKSDLGQADYFLKEATLLNHAGVNHAIWYSLVDGKNFGNLGLFDKQDQAKPAWRAFRFFAERLATSGAAQRVDHGGNDVFHFRFGQRFHVIWGAPRAISTTGTLVARNAEGEEIRTPRQVGDLPVVFEGTGNLVLGPQRVLADSRLDLGRAPWTYTMQKGARPPEAAGVVTTRFASFLGNPDFKPSLFQQLSLLAAGSKDRAHTIAMRYRAQRAGTLFASACLDRRSKKGDGTRFALLLNDQPVFEAVVGKQPLEVNHPVAVRTGDEVAFAFNPGSSPQADRTYYSVRIALDSDAAARC